MEEASAVNQSRRRAGMVTRGKAASIERKGRIEGKGGTRG